jgi:flagellar hook assembly protein FlgD
MHSINLDDVTGVHEDDVAAAVSLSWCPNPFKSTTSIAYTLTAPAEVSLAVYDVAGHRVRKLAFGMRGAGEHRVAWDGSDDTGSTVANGTYFLRLEAGDRVTVGKVSLLR